MKFSWKLLAFIAVGAAGSLAGKYIAERFVLKQDENSPTGFILMRPGIGLDEAASNILQFGTGYALARLLLSKS